MFAKNKTKVYFVSAIFFACCAVPSFSQDRSTAQNDSPELVVDYPDFKSYLDAMFDDPNDLGFNPYLLPAVFDGKFKNELFIKLPDLLEDENNGFFVLDTIYLQPENKRFVNQWRKKAYRNLISNHIELVKYKESDFPAEVEKITEVKPDPSMKIFKKEYDPDYGNVEVPGIFKPKAIYWIRNGSNLIQFSQNYISENWYKGGTGNFNLLSIHNYTANYKKDKVQFNNFIEWKLSFYSSPSDTLRSFKIGEDLIRYYGDFGLYAFNHWSYSTNIEIKTQLFNNYKENSQEMVSSFASPLIVNMGIFGMKYQLEKTFPKNKYKKLNLSADISPLSAQYTYVSNKKIDETRFGIEKGKTSLWDLGSTINAKLVLNFNREVSYTSRFKLFTNYEKTIIESENELNISLNRYFSTRIYLYARFDDSQGIVKDVDLGYFQLNEVLTFGFNFKW